MEFSTLITLSPEQMDIIMQGLNALADGDGGVEYMSTASELLEKMELAGINSNNNSDTFFIARLEV